MSARLIGLFFIFTMNSLASIYGQDIPYSLIANKINECSNKDTIVFKIDNVNLNNKYYEAFYYNSNHQLLTFKKMTNSDTAFFQRQYQYDQCANLTGESLIDIPTNKINYYTYFNEYKFGKLKLTKVIQTNVIMKYKYNISGKLKQIYINTQNDSMEFIFGYPQQFEYDFEYDTKKIYSYKKAKLVKVEINKFHPQFTETSTIKYRYNSQGNLIEEQNIEDDYLLKDIIYNYDEHQRPINITIGYIIMNLTYISIHDATPDKMHIFRNNKLSDEVTIKAF